MSFLSLLYTPFLVDVGAPILVYDLFWTLNIKGIIDTNHMLTGSKRKKKNKQVEAGHDLCAHKANPQGNTL